MSIRLIVGFVAFGLGACASSDDKGGGGGSDDSDTPIETQHGDPDADLDGFTEADGDCNDLNAGVYPGAIETCDGLDNDCNGQVDEGVTQALVLSQQNEALRARHDAGRRAHSIALAAKSSGWGPNRRKDKVGHDSGTPILPIRVRPG
jgi:hypothetical protein